MNISKFVICSLIILLSSCSSSVVVNQPYENCKIKISEYFEKRGNISISASGRRNKRIYFGAFYQEGWHVLSENCSWSHNLGTPKNKSHHVLPKILTVGLKRLSSSKSKISVEIYKHGLFFEKRVYGSDEKWLESLQKIVE